MSKCVCRATTSHFHDPEASVQGRPTDQRMKPSCFCCTRNTRGSAAVCYSDLYSLPRSQGSQDDERCAALVTHTMQTTQQLALFLFSPGQGLEKPLSPVYLGFFVICGEGSVFVILELGVTPAASTGRNCHCCASFPSHSRTRPAFFGDRDAITLGPCGQHMQFHFFELQMQSK